MATLSDVSRLVPTGQRAKCTESYGKLGLKADLELKQRALDRTVPVDGQPGRYRPPDDIIDFLDRL